MINHICQLVSTKLFSVKCEETDIGGGVLVRPRFLSICHADQRYYLGQRPVHIMKKKLPMALVHECCGEVVYDPRGRYESGQKVVLIPNVPGNGDGITLENYRRDSGFLSSGLDGFLQELLSMPEDRLIPFVDIDPKVAAITELLSVAVHAVSRFSALAHGRRDSIAVWGDGSVSYLVCCVLKKLFPQSRIYVIGMTPAKLSMFTFVDQTFMSGEIPGDFSVDHAFECVGGEGSGVALDDIIQYIHPQGTAVLMGVSEAHIGINTRDILEKGMTLVGCSRSGRKDFEDAVSFLQDKTFEKRLRSIVYFFGKVKDIDGLNRVFADDLNTPFKTVFEWAF